MPIPPECPELFEQALNDHLSVMRSLPAQMSVLERIAVQMNRAVLGGNKILLFGNGGSAADAQHLAAELVGRFRRERRGLPAIALTTDTSILTAVANDFGYNDVFLRQIEALCVQGDVVIGLSTSGNSRNVCSALRRARDLGAITVAFTGAGGGLAAGVAELALCIASTDTARVQEAHIFCGHMLCDWVELSVCQTLPSESEKLPR